MKILIVDDSKAMRMLVRRGLREAGFHGDFTEASNGLEALQVVQTGNVDLILSDWNMPEMNGMDLLLQLKTLDRPLKFGFVTSETSTDMRSLAVKAGALFVITKPFTPEVFRSALEPILGA